MIPPSFDTHFYRCIFTDGEQYDIDFLELCRKQEKLTFNTLYLNPEYRTLTQETPFKEIRLAFPGEYYPNHPILEPKTPFDGSYQEYIIALKDGLKRYLIRMDDNQKYLMFHSSGMDSRFISGTMAELRRDGKKDFANVHFRCHQPENEAFLYIMKLEGWPESQFSVCPGKEKDYYDIGRDDVCVHGWCSYSNQMNFWSDMGINPKDYIAITGEGGELFKYMTKYKHPPYKFCNNYHLNMLIDHNPGKGEWDNQWALYFKDLSMPLWSFDYMAVSNRVHTEWVGEYQIAGWDRIRTDLVKSVGLDGIQYKEPDYHWGVSPERGMIMNDLFYGGKFYMTYKKQIPENINFAQNPCGWESQLWAFAVTIYDKL